MIEMQARLLAQIFRGVIPVPEEIAMRDQATTEDATHRIQFPDVHDRLPHLQLWEDWMDSKADLIGCNLKWYEHPPFNHPSPLNVTQLITPCCEISLKKK